MNDRIIVLYYPDAQDADQCVLTVTMTMRENKTFEKRTIFIIV
jgi:hypothetical protein